MVLEPFLELRIGGSLNQLRQGRQDLVLGVVDILEAMVEQLVESLDVLCEQAHDLSPVTRV
jgi:hypothetical protein